MRDLDMRLVSAEGQGDQELPVLMPMGATSEGRLGCLSYLSGPTKLENIGGSFLADAEDTDWTMKRRETAWIYKRWGCLSGDEDNVREPFQRLNHSVPEYGLTSACKCCWQLLPLPL